ncbi:MAG: hypothetical protein ACP5HC_06325 [Caldisericum sp.]
MNLEEFKKLSLKARTIKVSLPSGIEIDFVLPTTGRFLEFARKTPTQEDIIQLLNEGMPEGLKVEDLPLTDFFFLQEVVSNFFENIQKTSPSGSSNTQEGS